MPAPAFAQVSVAPPVEPEAALGGMPKFVVRDNLKAAVTNPTAMTPG